MIDDEESTVKSKIYIKLNSCFQCRLRCSTFEKWLLTEVYGPDRPSKRHSSWLFCASNHWVTEYSLCRCHPVKGVHFVECFDKTWATTVTYLFSRCIDPCQMGEMRVDAASNDFSVDFFKFFEPIGECQNFSWANECTGNNNELRIAPSTRQYNVGKYFDAHKSNG